MIHHHKKNRDGWGNELREQQGRIDEQTVYFVYLIPAAPELSARKIIKLQSQTGSNPEEEKKRSAALKSGEMVLITIANLKKAGVLSILLFAFNVYCGVQRKGYIDFAEWGMREWGIGNGEWRKGISKTWNLENSESRKRGIKTLFHGISKTRNKK